jgi:pyruvate,water dikinase
MLSVRRNRELARLASLIRDDPELGRKLEAGEAGDSVFEEGVEAFHLAFGDAVFADQQCFGERDRLVRLLLSLVEAPAVEAVTTNGVEELTERFLSGVDAERREMATELLELGRISYRLRDDDNIYLSRFESLVLEAVEEGRSRLHQNIGGEQRFTDLQDVVKGLRHPNLVVEASAPPRPIKVERGFRAMPRQLVGQPAGPGVASAEARVVENVDDLFRFRAGEVLVCDAVDPNMTFVVPMASAVIERRGGMLIHGAIIAREYGLPCVTGVPEATTLIATGDQLTVDGFLGIVTVSREPGPPRLGMADSV